MAAKKTETTEKTTETSPETPAPVATVTQPVLEETPERALRLLRALGTSIPMRRKMSTRGYTDEEQLRGWHLLHEASGYEHGSVAPQTDTRVRDAIVALDDWDEDGFRIVRATLIARYPEVAKRVLAGIAASEGALAVIGVAKLLERLSALETSTDADDQAALALLETRGITAAERKRLQDLVQVAQQPAMLIESATADELALAKRKEAQQKALIALRIWFEEWSEIARSAIKRRDELIRLGLAKLKTKKEPKPAPE